MKSWNSIQITTAPLVFLKDIIANLRPAGDEDCIVKMNSLILWIENEESVRQKIIHSLEDVVHKRIHINLFTDAGLTGRHGFFTEFFTRISEKILPQPRSKHNLRGLLSDLFSDTQDYIWVEEISDELWEKLFRKLELQRLGEFLEPPICDSMLLISNRICSLALEKELVDRIHLKSKQVFLDLPKLCYQYIDEKLYLTNNHPVKLQILESLDIAEELMYRVKKQQKNNGVSVDLIYLTIRINQNINRLKTFLAILQTGDQKNTALVSFFKELIRAENKKYSVSGLVQESTEMLALQIIEHNSTEGEHYISRNFKGYLKSFVAAMGGGVIVVFTTIVKFLISFMKAAPLMEGLLYSLNYAACFILIYVSGSALATKQPAMTAPALAREFEKNENPEQTADLIIWMARSQFASFLGNLIIVLPIPGLLSWLYFHYTGSHFLNPEKAMKVLDSLNPFTSGTVIYACITGVFLFTSSIVTGYADNYIDYQKIPLRIYEHPRLNRWFSKRRLAAISLYIDKKGGSLVGNFALGFFLGMAAFVNIITGLPFGIQHITIASSSASLAFAGLGNYLHSDTMFLTLMGVFLIGFFNFLVSFGLSLFMAMRAKKVSYHAQQELFLILLARLWYKPRDFFFPPFSSGKNENK